jgi:hypothetical protein
MLKDGDMIRGQSTGSKVATRIGVMEGWGEREWPSIYDSYPARWSGQSSRRSSFLYRAPLATYERMLRST